MPTAYFQKEEDGGRWLIYLDILFNMAQSIHLRTKEGIHYAPSSSMESGTPNHTRSICCFSHNP
jgi:hypothetical protein